MANQNGRGPKVEKESAAAPSAKPPAPPSPDPVAEAVAEPEAELPAPAEPTVTNGLALLVAATANDAIAGPATERGKVLHALDVRLQEVLVALSPALAVAGDDLRPGLQALLDLLS